jgi:hypothetical protein
MLEERRLRRVSKDGPRASWFETAQMRLLTMRSSSILKSKPYQAAVAFSAVAAEA